MRFTRKGDDLYVTILGTPKGKTVTLNELGHGVADRVHGTRSAYLLGDPESLHWITGAGALEVKLPDKLPGSYAYVLKLNG